MPDAGDPFARLLHDADTPVSPPPAFAGALLDRLLEELASAPEAGAGSTETGAPASTTDPGSLPPTPLGLDHFHNRLAPVSQPRWEGKFRPHGSWNGYLATAVLLVFTIVGAYAGIVASHRSGLTSQSVDLPVLAGIPEAMLPPGVTEDTVLFQRTLDVIPPAAMWAGVERVTLDPATEWPQGTRQTTGVGPYLYRIEAGILRVRANGPIEVGSAGSASARQIPGDTDLTLRTGDQVFIPSGVTSLWRNAGTTPATVLDTGVAIPGGIAPSGVTYTSPIDAFPITPPVAPAELTVRRVTVEPGASLSNQPTPGLALVGVEAGVLTIDWMWSGTLEAPTRSTQVLVGNWVDLGAHQPFVRTLSNDEPTPLVLMLMTVTPTGASTPTP